VGSWGTNVRIESADIVLIGSELEGFATVVAISSANMDKICWNLLQAFVYNAALIPDAGGLLYPSTGTHSLPVLAAGAMALSRTTNGTSFAFSPHQSIGRTLFHSSWV
jgi:Cu+-exporting ATPase